ncbi:MAG TPA: glycosyltransferase family 4 protein [Gaiellales bacterium]|nr:glycosyltransferase family 4 protein [Gaiellales bacterium]
MRVLVVHNRYRTAQPSGENAVVDEETALLRQRGAEVEVLSVESDDIAGWPFQKKLTLPARVVWSRDGARRVRDAVTAFGPTVVHFHNTFPLLSPAALRAAHGSGVRVVQTLHNFRPLCPAATFLRDGRVCEDCLGRAPIPAVVHGCYRSSRAATLPLAVKDALHSAIGTWSRAVDTYITPSEFARSRYVKAGWAADRVVVKYNTAPDPGAREPSRDGGFVCLSRLAPEKGVDVLLDAWGQAFPTGDARLRVVGAGELDSALRSRAARLVGVEFTGQVPRERGLEILADARALVIPSRWYEVFPRIVAEAYALGVPVIASRLGSLAEIVADDRTGLLVDPGDPANLARALRTLAEDAELARRLGVEARRAYERNLSPEATTDRLLEIYAGEPVSVATAAPEDVAEVAG